MLDLLNAEINKALAARALLDRFETRSLDASRMDRPSLRRYLESEVDKWGRLVRDIGIKIQ